MSGDPTKYQPEEYGSDPLDGKIETEMKYGFKLTSDSGQTDGITLPQVKPSLKQFQYEKQLIDPSGENVRLITYHRLAQFKPVSRPYGETILEEEASSIVKKNAVIYASKYLPRADELTAYVDLNERDSNGGKYDHDDYFLIRMGDMLETPTPFTPSWTPTISPTMSYTPTLTGTPAHTPSPTITGSPDYRTVGKVFRSLWDTNDTDYINFVLQDGMIGVKFKHRLFVQDFYKEYDNVGDDNGHFQSKKASGSIKPMWNPFAKIVVRCEGLTIPDNTIEDSTGKINPTYRDHLPINVSETFGTDVPPSWNQMINQNERIFNYGDVDGKVLQDPSTGAVVGFEMYIPFKEDGEFSINENRFQAYKNTEISPNFYNNSASSVFFIFEASGSGFHVTDVEVIPSTGLNQLDEDTYNTNSEYNIEHGQQVGDSGEIIYLYSVETPTPSMTITITHPTPTPTKTVTPTVSLTPTPTQTVTQSETVTITHPTPTPTLHPTPTPTMTQTKTLTDTMTETLTFTPTPTMTYTETLTMTPTPTMTETNTNTMTPTNTNTITETNTNTITETITITHPTPTPTMTVTETITKTMELFNINRDRGVNIIGSLNIIQRDGVITSVNRFFNIGRKPIFIDFDGNVDGNVDI